MVHYHPIYCDECGKVMGYKKNPWGCDCGPICDECSKGNIAREASA